jgi:hypothetical protein
VKFAGRGRVSFTSDGSSGFARLRLPAPGGVASATPPRHHADEPQRSRILRLAVFGLVGVLLTCRQLYKDATMDAARVNTTLQAEECAAAT